MKYLSQQKVNSRRARKGGGVQKGFGLPLAIFVITVLSSLLIAMSGLVNDNAQGRSEQADLIRAMIVAQSGAALGLNQMFNPSDSPTYANTVCASSMTFSGLDIGADEGMGGCSVAVGCEVVGVAPNTMYVVTSTGSCNGVSRQIQVDAR